MRQSSVVLMARVVNETKLPTPVVDIGGRGYKDMWKSLGNINAKIMDIQKDADIVADITNMPQVKSDSIGSIICLDTFEHVTKPWLAIDEIYRIMKPDGILVLDVPFIWDYHKHEEDYYRYTPMGLEVLCEKFKKLESGWMDETSPIGVEYKLYEDGGRFMNLPLPRSCSYFIGKKG